MQKAIPEAINQGFFCVRYHRQQKSMPAITLVSKGPETSTPNREKTMCHGDRAKINAEIIPICSPYISRASRYIKTIAHHPQKAAIARMANIERPNMAIKGIAE